MRAGRRIPRPTRYWLLYAGAANACVTEFCFAFGPLDRWAVCIWPAAYVVLLFVVWLAWRHGDRLQHYADRLESAALMLVDASLDMLIADVLGHDRE